MSSISGSEIAKNGYKNEQDVCDIFNKWIVENTAQDWLTKMNYDLDSIQLVFATKIGQKGFKSDVSVRIWTKHNEELFENEEKIQVKLVSSKKGFNQIDKSRVDKYINAWHMSNNIAKLLKYYDGELSPYKLTRDPRRMFIDEFTIDEQRELKDFFEKNITMIIADVIRARGKNSPEWTLVINTYTNQWCLLSINETLSKYMGDRQVIFTKTGNIHLGNISLQRKGGDNGADTANMLQFKVDPMILFE